MATVLVVDDDPSLRRLERRLLARAGHDVIDAADGVAALRHVRRSRPDLVVTDLAMHGMGGRELVAHLRRHPATAGIPIIAFSSSPLDGVPVDVALAKPFDARHLEGAVEALLSREGDAARASPRALP